MKSNGYERRIEYFGINYSRRGRSIKRRKRNFLSKRKGGF
jgi:hypothetical protein